MRKALQMGSMTVSSTVIEIDNDDWGWDDQLLKTASRAVISPRLAGVMITWSGDDPTATVGHPIVENGWAAVEHRGDIQRLKFIREASTDATVTVTLER